MIQGARQRIQLEPSPVQSQSWQVANATGIRGFPRKSLPQRDPRREDRGQPGLRHGGERFDLVARLASAYFPESRCSRKNDHIKLEASMLSLVGPVIHSRRGLPPGHVWPPPWTA